MAFSPDGKRIVSGTDDKTVKVWDAATGQVVRTLKSDVGSNYTDYFDGLAFSDDGKRIVAVSEKGVVRSWDAIKGQEVIPCTDRRPPKYQLKAISPDGKLRIWADGYRNTFFNVSETRPGDPPLTPTPTPTRRRLPSF